MFLGTQCSFIRQTKLADSFWAYVIHFGAVSYILLVLAADYVVAQ